MQKQANKIQQRQQFFAHKTSERRKIICFALLKKIEIALTTSFTILLIFAKIFHQRCLAQRSQQNFVS